jgi:hypothetical protein
MGNPWTPGPWNSDDLSVFDDDGDPICDMAMSITEEDKGTQRANARLIAAAPEMATIIHELLATHVAHHNHPAHVAARALLSRIRGETL